MIRKIAYFFALLFISANVYAVDILSPNSVFENQCTISNTGVYSGGFKMIPIYEDIVYNCGAGYYLPADSEECIICPENSYCAGGNYTYSQTESQGNITCPVGSVSEIGSTNILNCKSAIVCELGYYLPANSTECSLCKENHYCGGGEFNMSDQDFGINECPSELVTPMGMATIEQCGKILHVGDNIICLTSVQETTPALAVKIDDKVYYAKTTPISVGIKPMNENTTESLRLKLDGVEYSIHDNTIKGEN
ncbi:MAG: hypothetical protein MJ158_02780 [Alphaproteobacteria bacterium]|nr:hypothetical protein [Alphaproteobacteria bacterium]